MDVDIDIDVANPKALLSNSKDCPDTSNRNEFTVDDTTTKNSNITITIGDERAVFDVAELQTLHYFQACLSDRWNNHNNANKENENNDDNKPQIHKIDDNHCKKDKSHSEINVFSDSELAVFNCSDLKLLLLCARIHHIPYDLVPDFKVLEGLIRCDDYCTGKDENIIKVDILVDYLKNAVPCINQEIINKWLARGNDEDNHNGFNYKLFRLAAMKFQQWKTEKITQLKNEICQDYYKVKGKLIVDSKTATDMFIKKCQFSIIVDDTIDGADLSLDLIWNGDGGHGRRKLQLENGLLSLWELCDYKDKRLIDHLAPLIKAMINVKFHRNVYIEPNGCRRLVIAICLSLWLFINNVSIDSKLGATGSKNDDQDKSENQNHVANELHGFSRSDIALAALKSILGLYYAVDDEKYQSVIDIVKKAAESNHDDKQQLEHIMDFMICYIKEEQQNWLRGNAGDVGDGTSMILATCYDILKICVMKNNKSFVVAKADKWIPLLLERKKTYESVYEAWGDEEEQFIDYGPIDQKWFFEEFLPRFGAGHTFDIAIEMNKYVVFEMDLNDTLPAQYGQFMRDVLGVEWLFPQFIGK